MGRLAIKHKRSPMTTRVNAKAVPEVSARTGSKCAAIPKLEEKRPPAVSVARENLSSQNPVATEHDASTADARPHASL